MKEKYSVRWCIYAIISIIVLIYSSIYQKSDAILIICSISGIIYVLLTAKLNKYAYIFGIINVVIYGIILLNQKIYGSALYNLVYSFPMLAYGFIKYIKDEKNSKEITIRRMRQSQRYITSIGTIIIILIVSVIISFSKGSQPLLDSIATIGGFIGIYLLSNRYIEQWMVWIVVNFTNCIIWFNIVATDIQKLPILLMWMIYFINSIYGYISFKKIEGK